MSKLACTLMGHEWVPLTASSERRGKYGTKYKVERDWAACIRCGVKQYSNVTYIEKVT